MWVQFRLPWLFTLVLCLVFLIIGGCSMLAFMVFTVAYWYTAPGPTRDLRHQARITHGGPKLLKEDDTGSEDSIVYDGSTGRLCP